MCYNGGALGHFGGIFMGFGFYNLGVARFQLITWITMQQLLKYLTLLLIFLVFHSSLLGVSRSFLSGHSVDSFFIIHLNNFCFV